ncbi:MAG: hypothetical protein RRY03_07190, partial [Oscillospiraceae bacterium]
NKPCKTKGLRCNSLANSNAQKISALYQMLEYRADIAQIKRTKSLEKGCYSLIPRDFLFCIYYFVIHFTVEREFCFVTFVVIPLFYAITT